MTEDWLPTLRIQRVRGRSGDLLFDGETDDPAVGEAIDEANTEYLDQLLDVTGDAYMGRKTIDSETFGGP